MKIYFDENFSPYLVKGLRAFQSGKSSEGIEILSIAEIFGKGTTDEIWIPRVACQNGIVVTQDLNIYRSRQQWQLCQSHKIGIVFVQPPKKGWSYWSIIQLVVKLWKEITRHSMETPRPFGAKIKATAGRLEALG